MVATQTVASRYQVDDELDIDDELCALSAHDVWVDQPIVVTLANPDALGAPRPARRADRVGAAAVEHPNTLGIYDAGVDGAAPSGDACAGEPSRRVAVLTREARRDGAPRARVVGVTRGGSCTLRGCGR